MKLDWFVYRARNKINRHLGVDYKKSYSQSGEDLIARYIFDCLKIVAPNYLDIGAHHPTYLNNTHIFYETGSRGINIEPDPTLIDLFKKQRPKDVNLNVGVAATSGILPFYILSPRTLNTFSQNDANAVVEEGQRKIRIERVMQIPVFNINDLIAVNLDKSPDFFLLDVEGMDFIILQSLDFAKTRPKVICVETITYSEKHQGRKVPEIAEWLGKQNYFLYADTHINSIFVDREVW
ncbi:MAG: FkbM family methyltransferase [Methylococcales bacterium]